MKFTLYILTCIVFFSGLTAGEPALDRIVVGGFDGTRVDSAENTYPVLLALSGGGARGLSAIGILKAFEEKNISVAAIAGTSIGGIVGGLYACGYTTDDLVATIGQINFTELFTNQPNRLTMFLTQRQERDRHLLSVRFDGLKPYIPQALTAGQKLTSLLTRLTTKPNYLAGGDFSRYPVPFKTICTDLVTGKEVVISSGSLAEAMRATMAFPLAFTAVERDSQILMDGGMMIPVPVDIVRSMCDTVDFVVAVNTTSPLLTKDNLVTPIDIANQATTIMTADKLTEQLEKADYVIDPPIGEYTSTDFDKTDSLIEIGYRCGLEAADQIIEVFKKHRSVKKYTFRSITVRPADSRLKEKLAADLLHRNVTRLDLIKYLKKFTTEEELFRCNAVIEKIAPAADDSSYTLTVDIISSFHPADFTYRFVGNSVFSDDTLLALFIFSDALSQRQEFEAGLDGIVRLYQSRGYDLANIRKVDLDYAGGVVTIIIDEAIIRKIDVANNIRTKGWLVKSNFPLKPGEPFSTRKATAGISNIYGTDLFDRVTLDLVPYDSGARINIGVKEKKYTQLRLGWHWDDEYQSEEFIELRDENVSGIGLESLTHARYGQDRQLYFSKLKINRIFFTYLTAQFNLYHDRLDRTIWLDGQPLGLREENKTGLNFRIGQQISRLGTLSGGIVFEHIEYEDERDDTYETLELRSIYLESLVENFDRVPFPERGKKHLFLLQLVGKYLGGEVEFTRYFSSIESYFPLGRFINYHPKLSIGLSRKDLPPSEKFYLGGMYSFSGFRTNELSGDKFLLLNQELRFKLPFRFYFTMRYDIGDVYRSTDDIKLKNLYHGFGVSLAFDSPIGPFDFGYGVTDTDDDRFYFNAGFDF
ncbi:MAG: patatin-like phospholipase family protein [Candidatus Zixiibacteriota bacterium]